jgi:hypothetical protein
MPVREAKRFGSLCGMFKQPILEQFFLDEGENTLATSMAKKGWLLETSVSQKKFTTRARENNSATQPQSTKWKLFKNKAESQGQ